MTARVFTSARQQVIKHLQLAPLQTAAGAPPRRGRSSPTAKSPAALLKVSELGLGSPSDAATPTRAGTGRGAQLLVSGDGLVQRSYDLGRDDLLPRHLGELGIGQVAGAARLCVLVRLGGCWHRARATTAGRRRQSGRLRLWRRRRPTSRDPPWQPPQPPDPWRGGRGVRLLERRSPEGGQILRIHGAMGPGR